MRNSDVEQRAQMTEASTNPGFSLAVTSAGMVSSLGIDLVSSCAASRAGLYRSGPLDEFHVGAADSQDVEPVHGCPVFDLTKGYQGLGRLVRLGQLGMEDLARRTAKDLLSEAGLVINLSGGYWLAAGSGGSKSCDQAVQNQLEVERDLLRAKLIPGLHQLIGFPLDPTRQQLVFGDSCGFLTALQIAADRLSRGEFTRCVVGGIDSYIDQRVLLNLADCGALKTPDVPTGLIPGEGAAFLVVELPGSGDSVLTIEGLHCGREKLTRRDDEPFSGEVLSSVVGRSLDTLMQRESPASYVLGSHNGDVFRAWDWGTALVRLRAGRSLPDLPEWHPAASFGEVGAATGFFQVCLAMQALARGYAPGNGAVAWLAGDDGSRGAYGVKLGASPY